MKKVCIYVSNKELNALEDIIVAKLSVKQYLDNKPLALKVWSKLVKAYDSG